MKYFNLVLMSLVIFVSGCSIFENETDKVTNQVELKIIPNDEEDYTLGAKMLVVCDTNMPIMMNSNSFNSHYKIIMKFNTSKSVIVLNSVFEILDNVIIPMEYKNGDLIDAPTVTTTLENGATEALAIAKADGLVIHTASVRIEFFDLLHNKEGEYDVNLTTQKVFMPQKALAALLKKAQERLAAAKL